jgi:hypothetical protein
MSDSERRRVTRSSRSGDPEPQAPLNGYREVRTPRLLPPVSDARSILQSDPAVSASQIAAEDSEEDRDYIPDPRDLAEAMRETQAEEAAILEGDAVEDDDDDEFGSLPDTEGESEEEEDAEDDGRPQGWGFGAFFARAPELRFPRLEDCPPCRLTGDLAVELAAATDALGPRSPVALVSRSPCTVFNILSHP